MGKALNNPGYYSQPSLPFKKNLSKSPKAFIAEFLALALEQWDESPAKQYFSQKENKAIYEREAKKFYTEIREGKVTISEFNKGMEDAYRSIMDQPLIDAMRKERLGISTLIDEKHSNGRASA